MTTANAAIAPAQHNETGISDSPQTGPSAPERLLHEVIRAALAGSDPALQCSVELLTRHPGIDYVLLEAPPPAGGPNGLRIEHLRGAAGDRKPQPAAPAVSTASSAHVIPAADEVQWWPRESGAMPQPLLERGLASAVRIPFSGGALSVGSRDVSAISALALARCRAVAHIFEAALERRRLEAELLQRQRAHLASELATGIVHDFNNVLTGVVGFGALLRSQLPDDHPARRYVELIEMLGASAADLGRQLLDLARHGEEAAELLDPNDIARDVGALAECATAQGIAVELDLEESLPSVRGSPSLLRQALTNLVLNAADAAPDGGAVLLRTRLVTGAVAGEGRDIPAAVAERYVAIDVVDHGTGIPPEVLPHVFEPFFTTKDPGSGTGLGLTSVRRIARRYGGSVEVESTPGAGSTFMLRLPVAAD